MMEGNVSKYTPYCFDNVIDKIKYDIKIQNIYVRLLYNKMFSSSFETGVNPRLYRLYLDENNKLVKLKNELTKKI